MLFLFTSNNILSLAYILLAYFSAEDRREYLESLLRECKKEEAAPVLDDDSLNDILARRCHVTALKSFCFYLFLGNNSH